MLPGGKGSSYEQNLAEIRGNQQQAYEDNPKSYIAGMGAAGVAGGAALAKSGLSFGARAAEAGMPLLRIAAGGAADGAILGGVNGVGSGEGVEDRIQKGLIGSTVGAGVGLAAPYAVAGATNLLKPIVSPLMARARPASYANAALGEGLKRSGSTIDDITQALIDARADNQPVFTVADAMGQSGQRLLSTVVRNPNEARQPVVEALIARQAGQGRRVVNSLTEAFDAPDTAAHRTTALTGARDTEASQLYGQARQQANPVDISPAVQAIDQVLQPGVHSIARPNNQIAHDSIEGALSRVRSMITDGRSNLTDFNAVFRAKLDLDDMITKAENQGAGNRAHYLGNVQRVLDQTLADASAPYAAARDAFAAASRRIEAVGAGKTAATRGRAPDTIAVYQAMTPEEQAAFRVGYADPLIEQAQSAAVGVDKSRPLISDATGMEFPVVTAPGRGARLWTQLGREKTMFETRNAATGGSRTADNLADAADMSQFDPQVMARLTKGDLWGTITAALAKTLNEAKGLPPSVLSKVGEALMQTDPTMARQALTAGAESQSAKAARRAVVSAVIANTGSSAAARR
ncbi:hypothetical protein FJ872_31975 [Mesorhizobium sp. B2-5-9]|uniref:hypothetical protein n=1 Tax=Mesorhizobium sp. B2-5-9 TaxID=2589921 RepID=UPI00112A6C88|nr:hypothetical protein [Mesorhizobium sp. B2-5-9]TPJ97633.1 hypothetical protein FJ872_31975 [Mesorhizobium sp. B2-5-9]